jgi:class 3 adenylate cyclase
MASSHAPLVFCPTCRREFDGDRFVCPSDGDGLQPVPRDAPRPGSVLDGRLLVVSRLGAGGMGTIFRAVDLHDRRELALKVLKARFGQDRTAVEQFYHEARAAGRLSHPNIVRIEAFGRSCDGYLYIAMELLGGFPLAALLADRQPLPPALVVHVARQVCAALAAAHRKGTVHRDLKPENIQVVPAPDGEPGIKVLDFGIASVLAFDLERGLVPEGRVSGTPAYMSPEQVMGRPVDPRSDLYGLGVLLFEMLAGRPPFDADDPVALCRKHLTEAPPDLSQLLPRDAVVLQLARLVRHLLHKRPARRPPAVDVVLRRLDAIQERLGPPPPITAVTPRWPGADEEAPAPSAGRSGGSPPAATPTGPRPPLLRLADGSLRVLPARGGGAARVAFPPVLPREGTATLVDAPRPIPKAVEAQTLRSALWLCPACSCLNARAEGPCEACGARLQGPRTGVPIVAESWPSRPAEPRWHSLELAEDEGIRLTTAPPTRLATDGDDVPRVVTPVTRGPAAGDPDGAPLRTEVALLHVILAGESADGAPLGTEALRSQLDPWMVDWRAGLQAQGGFVCLDAGTVVRVLFGLPVEASAVRDPRWLERAVDASLALRDGLAEAARELRLPLHVRAALVTGRVWLEAAALTDLDQALRSSPVDLATRLARNAPAGETLVNASAWRRVANRFSGQACDTIRSRGSRHPELVYRLGHRLALAAGHAAAARSAREIVALAAPDPDPVPPPLPAEAAAH